VELGERDPVTGRLTTGHEWNGIKELDTPVPRVVQFFLAATALFSLVYWILMPAFPLWSTYTKGLLGIDQRDLVTKQVKEADARRARWSDSIATMSFADIRNDAELMRIVRASGRTLFGDNCAVCHGVNGTGSKGYPSLAARAWLWGGSPEQIAETLRVGINSGHDKTQVSQMVGFGRTGVLKWEEVNNVAAFVLSLSGQDAARVGNVEGGRKLYADNCATCHGPSGKGDPKVGAPDLTDKNWIYGGDPQSVVTSISDGRQGHMPHWEQRLTAVERRILSLYVLELGEGRR
jgi:cytochrome c oxidase cbb3-type subunit 3